MTKLKFQFDEFKSKNKNLNDDNRNFQEKIKVLEDKNAATKINQQNLKNMLKDKEMEVLRVRDSAQQADACKQEMGGLQKKVEDQGKKIKQLYSDVE